MWLVLCLSLLSGIGPSADTQDTPVVVDAVEFVRVDVAATVGQRAHYYHQILFKRWGMLPGHGMNHWTVDWRFLGTREFPIPVRRGDYWYFCFHDDGKLREILTKSVQPPRTYDHDPETKLRDIFPLDARRSYFSADPSTTAE